MSDTATPTDIFQRPADRATVQELYGAGLLTPTARDEALRWLFPPTAWWTWASRILLCLGAALVLAGVVFFFAYNWARMGRFLKLGVIEGALAISLLAAWWTGLERLVGKLLLLGACVFVGVFLAVYGQIYQTGADAYELFVGWAALILPWVLLSRFGALWVFWLAVTNAAILLYREQVVAASGFDSVGFLLAGTVNGIALALREAGVRQGRAWLRPDWLRWTVLAATLAMLTIPTFVFVIGETGEQVDDSLAPVFLIAALGALYRYYRFVSPDLLAISQGTTAFCVVLLGVIGKGLFELSTEAGMFLLFGLVIVGVVAAAAGWLRRQGRAISDA
ncbi:MAG: DUF2157 domain-containing protein [Planctomycetota bacterium]